MTAEWHVRLAVLAVGLSPSTGWGLTTGNRGRDRILTGRGGVRLSFYEGSALMTVDDFVLARV